MTQAIPNASILILTLALAACGGGSSGSSEPPVQVPTPTPTPSPTATPTPTPIATDPIIYNATTSTNFASEGRYYSDGGLNFHYNANTKGYYATTPDNSTFEPLQRDPNYTPLPGAPWLNFFLPGSRTYVLMRASGEAIDPDYRYFYSNLAAWGYNDSILRGATAFGIPAPFGSGPTGTVVRYIGLFEGRTDEQYDFEDERPYGSVSFAITMTFDPATGSARFQGRPIVSLLETHLLEPLLLDDIEWTAGYHAFYRPVPGEPDNKNYPLSGQFSGPAADELIGGLRFSYVSPLGGTTQEARGAFIAKR